MVTIKAIFAHSNPRERIQQDLTHTNLLKASYARYKLQVSRRWPSFSSSRKRKRKQLARRWSVTESKPFW